MKPVRLSADGPITVYMVPDKVADNLRKYCLKFCNDWLPNSPAAAKYRVAFKGGYGLCYDGEAFIDYLNTDVFPKQPSYVVERFEDAWCAAELPEKYRHLPSFSF